MKKSLFALFCVVLCLFVSLPVFAEGKNETAAKEPEPVAVPVTTTISTVSTNSSKVLATVNLIKNKTITQDDVDKYIEALASAGNDVTGIDETAVLQYLTELELLHQAYAKAGYVDEDFNMTEDTVNGILNYYIYLLSLNGLTFSTVEEFNAYVEENGFDISEIIYYYSEDYLFEKYLEDNYYDLLVDIPEITEEDITSFFVENQALFTNSEKVNIAHILFYVNDEAERATVKAEADSVYSQIKQGRLTFEKAVSTYSDDSDSVTTGGVLGWVNKPETPFEQEMLGMTPDLFSSYHKSIFSEKTYNELFKYDDGEITPVLESPFGYHIFKIMNHQNEKTLAIYDKVYPTETITLHDFLLNYLIPELLVENAKNIATSQMYSDLTSQATITY